MKLFIHLCVVVYAVLINQITFAQPATSYRYDWNRDGSRFVMAATVAGEGIVSLYDAEWRALASWKGTVFGVSFSPDGENLLIDSGVTKEIRDTDTFQTLRVLPIVGGVIWSPDGTELASFNPGTPGGMKFYSTTNGDLLREFTRADAPAWGWPYSPLWSPDGAYFAAYLSNQLALLDATTGMQIGTNYEFDGNVYPYSWSSDSTNIALGLLKEIPTAVEGSYPTGYESGSHWLNSIVVLEIATGNITTVRSGFRSYGTTLVWSPDDTQIATYLDGNMTMLDSVSGDVINSFDTKSNASIIGYSPSGSRLLTGLASDSSFDASRYSSSQIQTEPLSEFRQTALDGLIQIFVPIATLDRFAEIAVVCNAPGTLTDFDTDLTDPAAIAAQAQALLTAINALPEGVISPGCAADLHAIAEAIIAQTSLTNFP